MADALEVMINRIERFEAEKDALILDLVRDNEPAVISLNVDDQLFDQGITADGKEVVPSYRPSTIVRKIRKGDPYDRVTLRDQGDFHRSFSIVYRGDDFKFVADDYKKQWLERKYSPKIYGLTPQNVERMINLIRERFLEEAKKMIFS